MQECAIQGQRNAAPVPSVNPSLWERNFGPIVWPAHLDEDTGTVNQAWTDEMMKQRMQFWQPLGARMIWRTVVFN
jgi:hypothetical protein